MTRNPSSEALADPSALASPGSSRQKFVDVFRGLLIAHMALDHASLMFNAGRGAEELAKAAPATGDIWQFLTRFTGVPVAPGFFFMAGFMVALTSARRGERGVPDAEITKRLLIRGLVLIAADAVIMGLPRALMGFYSFVVLSCIGVGIIAVALLRHLSTKGLLATALAVLALHPLIDVSGLPVALQAILHEPVRDGAIRSLYPVIPWIAIVMLGFVAGRDALSRSNPQKLWWLLSAASLLLFFAIRLSGGYGNAYSYSSIASLEFWHFAKYPPDLSFLTWSFACVFASLAILSRVVKDTTPAILKPFEAFGRVPFFFYIVHFYVLGIAAAILRARFGLAETYLIWLLLLGVMMWPCAWYYRKKRERPNWVTRYL
ncbi:putative membrane protein [Povalibacter uvarum]|uniref:Putative membrane protein n=1 Tax=Povalibacter uvarum TaxID=732238 RepID=A0A841HMP3_9GAMM|nr:heparan-alpha-glucosaminide N-acetyltransferase domain-containing protein [Povalibacter uvarum]MBB6093352.1 putative membrane protein [Povalibacter uvarum]